MRKRSNKGHTGFQMKHSLGQNFILDESFMAEVAGAAGIEPGDCVLEIGPGMGTLTRFLAEQARQVLAIEVDETLKPYLAVALERFDNTTVVYRDVLTCDLAALCRETFGEDASVRVAANIPYYITTEILEKTIHELPNAKSLAFMVQKEVADKIVAGPGKEGYGPLAILCQMYYTVERALEVPAAAFTPKPRVDSTFLVFRRREDIPVTDPDFFADMLHRVFLLRRKTLLNNLLSQYGMTREEAEAILNELQVPLQVRAEALPLETLAALCTLILESRKKP